MAKKALIVGVRGKGVYVGGIGDHGRLITARKARVYAEQLLRAADATDKAWLLANCSPNTAASQNEGGDHG